MKYGIKLTILILIAIAIVSCEKENDSEDMKLVPLDIGNKWEYNSYQVQSGEEILIGSNSVEIDSILTLDIEGDEKEVYREISTDGYSLNTSFVNNTKEGFYMFGEYADFHIEYAGGANMIIDYEGDYLLTYSSLIAKFPVSIGETWNSTGIRFTMTYLEDTIKITPFYYQLEIKCIGTNLKVQTDKGSFDCIGYQTGQPDNYSNIYYSRGIGHVMSEFYENGELIEVIKLSDYKFN